MATEMKSREYRLTATTNEMPVSKITDSKSAAEYVRRFYQDDIAIYESAFILMLDKAMNTIGWAKISQGGICGTVVDIRIVAKYAVDTLASGVIFVHNHPSGQLFPSVQDDKLTSRLKDGLALLDIKLADSLIITPENSGFYSFRDNGKL